MVGLVLVAAFYVFHKYFCHFSVLASDLKWTYRGIHKLNGI